MTNESLGQILTNNEQQIILVVSRFAQVFKSRSKYLSFYILHFSLFTFHFSPYSFAQDSTARPNYRALRWILAGESVAYSASIYGLSKAWYKTPYTRFNVVDDAHEWQQIDKVGHFFTAYQICRGTAAVYQKTGITRKQAALYGALSGFLFLTPIEILDGFQYPVYGFSPSDMLANIAGPSLYLGQYALWGEERIQPKFSFYPTPLAKVRPELLGKNLSEQWLKDYNGQTYWFSVNLASFAPNTNIPQWLNVSVGYGIQDMVGAEISKSRSLGYDPYRQYYLSLDVDFRKIKTRRKTLKTFFFLLNTLKVPAPALAFSRRGLRGHWLYF